MVNSLRLVGHDEPVYLLDCGLSRAAARAARARTSSSSQPRAAPRRGCSKTVAPLAHPAEVMVLIDADMIVTRPLDELIERAREGEVVAVEHGGDRFCPEWGELLGLGPVRRGPYCLLGLRASPAARSATEVLRLMDDRQRPRRLRPHLWSPATTPTTRFSLLDQDVLNAILAASVEAERIVVLDRRLAPTPPFGGLRVVDERDAALRLRGRRRAVSSIHHFATKPWLEPTPHGRLLPAPAPAADRRRRRDPGAATRMLPLRLRHRRAAPTLERRARRRARALALAPSRARPRAPGRSRRG